MNETFLKRILLVISIHTRMKMLIQTVKLCKPPINPVRSENTQTNVTR